MREHAINSAFQDEAHDDVHALGLGHLGDNLWEERIAFASNKMAYRLLLGMIRWVVGAGRNDVAYAASRVVDVSEVSRDHVNVDVIHRLTGGGSDVSTNV